jgi:hypothetical protein
MLVQHDQNSTILDQSKLMSKKNDMCDLVTAQKLTLSKTFILSGDISSIKKRHYFVNCSRYQNILNNESINLYTFGYITKKKEIA